MAVVKAPSIPSVIIQRSGKKYAHVMVYKNKWIDGRCRRVESRKVGKIEGGIEAINNGKIIWDESFITLYPQLRSFDTWHHRGKLEFRPKEDELKVEKPKRQEVISLHAGATWALECLAAQSNIGKALSSVFSKYHSDLKLLSVAFYMVLNSTNTIHGYGPFAETTKLPWGGVLNDSSISRLFQSIDETDVDAFFKKLNSLNAKELESKDSERVFLALDSTSISTHSKELSLAQFGHNNDGDALRQLNVLFLVDQATGIPLFYRVYNGSTPDVSTVRRMIADSSILNGSLSKCVLVADRGYPSDDNISDCLRNNIHFLFRVPSTLAYFKPYVDESLETLSDANNYNDYIGQFYTTVEADFRYDEFEVSGKRSKKDSSARLFMHIYYDPSIYEDAKKLLLTNVAHAREVYNTKGSVDKGLKQFIDQCCEIKDDKAVIDNKKLNEMLRYRGIAMLISDEIKDPIDAWLHYRDRNSVEQAFETMKSRLSCDRFHVSKNESLTGKMLVQFIATSLLIMVRNRLAKYERQHKSIKDKFYLISISDQNVLLYLNNVMAKKLHEGWLYDEVTGKNRRFYVALGIKPPVSEKDNTEGFDGNDGTEESMYETDRELMPTI